MNVYAHPQRLVRAQLSDMANYTVHVMEPALGSD